ILGRLRAPPPQPAPAELPPLPVEPGPEPEAAIERTAEADENPFIPDAFDAEPAPQAQPGVTIVPRKSVAQGKRAAKVGQRELDLGGGEYQLPPLDLLSLPSRVSTETKIDESALEQNARLLETVLEDIGVKGQIVKVRPGPVVTLYELEPAP